MDPDQSLKYFNNVWNRNRTKKKTYRPNLNIVRKKHCDSNKQIFKTEYEKNHKSFCSITRTKQSNKNDIYKQHNSVFSDGPGNLKRYPRKCKAIRMKNASSDDDSSENRSYSWNDSDLPEDAFLDNLNKTDMEVDLKMEAEPLELAKQMNLSSFHHSCSAQLKDNERTEIPLPVEEERKYSPLSFFNEKQYSVDHPNLSVWKLPYLFPFTKLCNNGCTNSLLSALPEGKMGKLSIRKSGKIEAHIGGHKYKVCDVGNYFGDYSVLNFTKHDDSTSDLAVLGSVENWFTIVPDWHSLLTI